jgi:hypothetical protein
MIWCFLTLCMLTSLRARMHTKTMTRAGGRCSIWPIPLSIWYDTIWYNMIWYDMIWYNTIWYYMIRPNIIWQDAAGRTALDLAAARRHAAAVAALVRGGAAVRDGAAALPLLEGQVLDIIYIYIYNAIWWCVRHGTGRPRHAAPPRGPGVRYV